MSQQEFLSNQPIVIDNGSSVIKAGLAEVERPSCKVRSYVGYQKYKNVLSSDTIPTDNMWVGSDLNNKRGLFYLEYPIQHGTITNWNAMESIWSHIYSKAQLGRSSKDHPVFIAQSVFSPNKQTEKIAEIFFERFNVPAIFIAPQSLLSLYASGKDTGVVIDIGDGVSTYFPVYNGYAISPQIHRVDLGGQDITRYFQLLLRKSGYTFSSTSEFEIVREMKEACSECSTIETANSLKDNPIAYQLPDGNVIQIGNERWQIGEVLFNPQLVGNDSLNCAKLLQNTIAGCDIDLRKELYNNILLSGGATMTRNFGKRLLQELKVDAPSNTKIRLFAPPDRDNSAWNGGCMLASLSSFNNMWFTHKDYEMNGVGYIHQKDLLLYVSFKQTVTKRTFVL